MVLSRLAFNLVKSIVRFINTSPSHLVSSLVRRTSTQSSPSGFMCKLVFLALKPSCLSGFILILVLLDLWRL